MNIKFDEQLQQINDLIRYFAINETKKIYPITIEKQLNLSLKDIKEKIDYISRTNGTIELNYEVICENDQEIVDIVYDFRDIITKTVRCPKCGKEFEVTLENTYPVYTISNEYINYLKNQSN